MHAPKHTSAAMTNDLPLPPYTHEVMIGSMNVAPNAASIRPRTCATRSTRGVVLARGAEEQALDRIDVPAVGEEQDDVIIALHDRIVMRHDHRLAAHDGADRGAVGQFDLIDALADHARAALIAVDDGFECLGCAATQ